MYLKNKIEELTKNKKTIIFVDMDGVIAEYDVGNPADFKNKRPLLSNIKELEEISTLENVTICILSICKMDFQIEEKNYWLDLYAPFFKKENRNIISKETYPGIDSGNLKVNRIKQYIDKNEQLILIDDDNSILKLVSNKLPNVILFQDSSLVD